MERFRARDLLLLPNLLSLSRVPLAAAFALTVRRPAAAFGVLALAGLSDVLDGYFARRSGQATAIGATVDPIADKLFVGTVLASMVATGQLPVIAILLLTTRELGELPLLLYWASLPEERRRERREAPRANMAGKLATALQFVTISSALVRPAWTWPLLLCTGIAGICAAGSYWMRDLALGSGAERGLESRPSLPG